MYDENLRSMAMHAIAETEWHHSCVVRATKRVILWWPGNFIEGNVWYKFEGPGCYGNRTVHSFHFSNDMQSCHAPKICILHTSANIEKSKAQFFQTSILFQIIKFGVICVWVCGYGKKSKFKDIIIRHWSICTHASAFAGAHTSPIFSIARCIDLQRRRVINAKGINFLHVTSEMGLFHSARATKFKINFYLIVKCLRPGYNTTKENDTDYERTSRCWDHN